MPARVQSAISDHKYEVGQVVNFTPGKMNRESSPGPYQIVRHLPPDGSENQYRVKSIEEGYERVVHESQLGWSRYEHESACTTTVRARASDQRWCGEVTINRVRIWNIRRNW
jgi:hypothetical protein